MSEESNRTEERLQNVADRLGRLMEDARRNAEFAHGRGAHAEVSHQEGRLTALEALARSFETIDPGADPVGSALDVCRKQLDAASRTLPHDPDRNRVEGTMAALLEMILVLVRFRSPR